MKARLGRREFLKHSAAGVALATGAPSLLRAADAPVPATTIPRWRGFNLLEKFIARLGNAPFREADFAAIAGWGFNFVRLPMSYHCWSSPQDWRELREPVLAEIDAAVALGRQYGVHVCINFHRAPGYTVDASTPEPFNLWQDGEALEACVYHWRHFAQRYRDVPAAALSFNLLNEPSVKDPRTGELLDDAGYLRVARVLVDTIRAESPDRRIIADGLLWGRVPVPALAALGGVMQSTRGYEPMEITHWKADWVADSGNWPKPTWPLPVPPEAAAAGRAQAEAFRHVFRDNPIMQRGLADHDPGAAWDRARLEKQLIRPWRELETMGVPVHVGEFGAHNQTPHRVVLPWMQDLLSLWKGAGWGWALWNLRGSFGVLDSERPDVAYEDFRGHKLDRAMLELLQES